MLNVLITYFPQTLLICLGSGLEVVIISVLVVIIVCVVAYLAIAVVAVGCKSCMV